MHSPLLFISVSWLFSVSGHAAEDVWALERHLPSQEEEIDALRDHFYLTIGRRYFNFRSQDSNLTKLTQLQEIFEEDGEPTVIQAPEGTLWDLREVWSLPDTSLLLWRLPPKTVRSGSLSEGFRWKF